jgi:hypothetical protein
MLSRDRTSKEEVSKEISGISSDYHKQLLEFNMLIPTIKRDIVQSIGTAYSYNIKYELYNHEIYSKISNVSCPYEPIIRYKDCLDYLLSGNYLIDSYNKTEQTDGILNWIEICAYNGFEQTAHQVIHETIPTLKDYIDMIDIIDIAKSKYLYNSLNSLTLLPDKLNEIIISLNNDIDYISG